MHKAIELLSHDVFPPQTVVTLCLHERIHLSRRPFRRPARLENGDRLNNADLAQFALPEEERSAAKSLHHRDPELILYLQVVGHGVGLAILTDVRREQVPILCVPRHHPRGTGCVFDRLVDAAVGWVGRRRYKCRPVSVS